MFNGCSSLTSLETGNFIVSQVKNLEYMFFSCLSLKSLNLIGFNTSLAINMDSMFYGCESLVYLNINNFDTKNVLKMQNMFRGCKSLTSLNLSSFQISENTNYQNMFYGMANNLIYCVNDDFYEKIKLQLEEKKCSLRDYNCISDWKNTSKKVIAENGICVDQCIMTENYKYEYETKCYSSCPKGTTSLYNKNFICQIFDEIKFNNENNNNSNIFFKICQPRDFLKNECSPIKTKYDSMISMIKTDIKEGAINELLEDLLNGNKNDIYKEDDDVKYQITTSDNQKNNKYGNISTIDLEQCEDKLKYEYNISQNYSLLIFKYDYYIKEIYAPIIGYEVFHPITKEILDLNYCKMNKIDIIIPIDIKENELYKHEPNNSYYKDKCYSFHNQKGIDLTIYDRKTEYNDNNLALCTDNCYFDGYDNETKKVKCICEPQFNSSLITLDKIINKKKLLHNFIDIRSNSNIDVIKCYKNFLGLKGFIKNIGSYILLITLLIYIVGLFMFIIKGYKVLNDKIDKIMIKLEDINNTELILNNQIKKIFHETKSKKAKKKKSKNSKLNNMNLNNEKKKKR